MNDAKRLMELCWSCEKPDCPGECREYNELKCRLAGREAPTKRTPRPREAESTMEIIEVEPRPDGAGLKIINDAIEAMEAIAEYAEGNSWITPEEQSAMEGMRRRLENMRLREYIKLVDWRKLEET